MALSSASTPPAATLPVTSVDAEVDSPHSGCNTTPPSSVQHPLAWWSAIVNEEQRGENENNAGNGKERENGLPEGGVTSNNPPSPSKQLHLLPNGTIVSESGYAIAMLLSPHLPSSQAESKQLQRRVLGESATAAVTTPPKGHPKPLTPQRRSQTALLRAIERGMRSQHFAQLLIETEVGLLGERDSAGAGDHCALHSPSHSHASPHSPTRGDSWLFPQRSPGLSSPSPPPPSPAPPHPHWARWTFGWERATLYHLAAAQSSARYLARLYHHHHGSVASLAVVDRAGLNPLHYACWHGSLPCMLFLIGRHPALIAQCAQGDGCLPAHLLIMQGWYSYLHHVVNEANIMLVGPEGWSLWHEIACSGSTEAARHMLQLVETLALGGGLDSSATASIRTQASGWTPLHVAVRQGHREMVILLVIILQVSIHAGSVEGFTPRMVAVLSGHHQIAKFIDRWQKIKSGAYSVKPHLQMMDLLESDGVGDQDQSARWDAMLALGIALMDAASDEDVMEKKESIVVGREEECIDDQTLPADSVDQHNDIEGDSELSTNNQS
jgi:hypothetical protein